MTSGSKKGALTRLAAICLIHGMSFAASAAEKPFAAPQAADPLTATNAGSLAQVTLSLVLVLAAVFAAAWAMRRLRGMSRGGAVVQIIAEVALGSKERAVLVQVGKQQLLLGVTATQVSTLHVLTENVTPVSADQGIADSQSASGRLAATTPNFKAIWKRSLGL